MSSTDHQRSSGKKNRMFPSQQSSTWNSLRKTSWLPKHFPTFCLTKSINKFKLWITFSKSRHIVSHSINISVNSCWLLFQTPEQRQPLLRFSMTKVLFNEFFTWLALQVIAKNLWSRQRLLLLECLYLQRSMSLVWWPQKFLIFWSILWNLLQFQWRLRNLRHIF